jgi:hypothetical protein
MRKHIIGTNPTDDPESASAWLPLERIASVEVTSEDTSHPVEAALAPGADTGWRAAQAGEQTLRLIFDSPQQLRRIRLLFKEREAERLQEFVLRWSPDNGQTFHEIVRQQWNFNPQTAAEEIEDYQVELPGVTVLELKIIPDKGGGEAHASLAQFRLG